MIGSLIGGILIGIAAVFLMAMNGRIAGISGISSAIFPPWDDDVERSDVGWRMAFVVGLFAAPLLAPLITGEPVQQQVSTNVLLMVCAGFITGFGSVYGGGCTSGHGVCGMSRLSLRSIVATCTFMAAAIVTVFITRHVIGA